MADKAGRRVAALSVGLETQSERRRDGQRQRVRETGEQKPEKEREREREGKRGVPLLWVVLNSAMAVIVALHIFIKESGLLHSSIGSQRDHTQAQAEAIREAVRAASVHLRTAPAPAARVPAPLPLKGVLAPSPSVEVGTSQQSNHPENVTNGVIKGTSNSGTSGPMNSSNSSASTGETGVHSASIVNANTSSSRPSVSNTSVSSTGTLRNHTGDILPGNTSSAKAETSTISSPGSKTTVLETVSKAGATSTDVSVISTDISVSSRTNTSVSPASSTSKKTVGRPAGVGSVDLKGTSNDIVSVVATPTPANNGDMQRSGSVTRTAFIIGSKLKAEKAVWSFRARWQCLTSLKTSSWKWDPKPRLLPWPSQPLKGCQSKAGYLGKASNDKVTSGEYTADNWPVAESLKYVWAPKTHTTCGPHHPPSFVAFNAGEFCSSMRSIGGSLFVVGDSTSSHFFTSLVTQLATRGAPVKPVSPTPGCASLIASMRASGDPLLQHRLPCESRMACGSSLDKGGVLLHTAVSTFLRRVHRDRREDHEQSSLEDKDLGDKDKEQGKEHEQISLFKGIESVPELAWGHEMALHNASVVVMNRGAHFIGSNAFKEQLNHTLRELRGLLPRALLVYRSTAAGHPNCSLYEEPLKEPLSLPWWPFNWDHFAEQNEIARGMVHSVGGAFLDVHPMASLRPDWHIGASDCLHYCQPGPVNDWVKMFAKMLQDLI